MAQSVHELSSWLNNPGNKSLLVYALVKLPERHKSSEKPSKNDTIALRLLSLYER